MNFLLSGCPRVALLALGFSNCKERALGLVVLRQGSTDSCGHEGVPPRTIAEGAGSGERLCVGRGTIRFFKSFGRAQFSIINSSANTPTEK